MKIAINSDYGGFSLSDEVAKILREKGVKITFVGENYSDGSGPKQKLFCEDGSHYLSNEDFGIVDNNYYKWRADPRLIEAIEQIGWDKSSARFSKIRIVNIPDDVDWDITEYDGIETIEEVHNKWR